MPTPDPLRVVGLPGSLREGSYTRAAVQIALDGAQAAGAETELVDLRDYELPFCDGEDGEDPEDVLALRRTVRAAHGIVLGTPEYHGGYSGVLKNALDLMGFDELEGKMIGLVGVSGGSMGAQAALNSLRDVGRALHAWVVPSQAGVPRAWKHFEEDGTLPDEDLADRLRGVGAQVVRFARLHQAEETLEAFLEAWQVAPKNPGAEGR